MVVKKFIF